MFLNFITIYRRKNCPKVTAEKVEFLKLMKNWEINFSLVNQGLDQYASRFTAELGNSNSNGEWERWEEIQEITEGKTWCQPSTKC